MSIRWHDSDSDAIAPGRRRRAGPVAAAQAAASMPSIMAALVTSLEQSFESSYYFQADSDHHRDIPD